MPSIVVVWNANAGTSDAAAEVRKLLSRRTDCTLIEAASPEEARLQLDVEIRAGCRRVIAAGGDGTASLVLQTIVESGAFHVETAVLPLGTGNDLARTLGMPLAPMESLEIVSEGEVFDADFVECLWEGGRRVVANMCTAGNSGLYLQRLTPEMKQRWGPFCYLRGTLDVLADLLPFEVQLDWPDQPAQVVTLLNLFAANGRTTGGGVSIAPGAKLDDGLIEVIAVLDGSGLDLASLAADFVLSDFRNHPLVIYRQVPNLRVQAMGPMPVTIDGELVTDKPISIGITDHKLPMVRPQSQ